MLTSHHDRSSYKVWDGIGVGLLGQVIRDLARCAPPRMD